MKLRVIKRNCNWLIQSSYQRVLEVFFLFPEKEFSLSDLAQEAKVAKPNIGKILRELEQSGFITITKLSKIWRIRTDQNNKNFIQSKIIYNLHSINQSGLVEFLNQYYKNPKAVVLFGSFRLGEDISTSDIDIAIEIDEPKEYQTDEPQGLGKFERSLKREIQVHLFHRKRIDLHVFNNIANGVVLSGFLEVHP